ncbi:putative fad binding domain-containing protein [Botrytis fragariae]|uniref:Putative fad binding domain-containing protein n=1 Tax=Botrytis fragariae TaxID=1964551 RepID=A0A8H6AZ92_9HELO|nr:putative fad binding domain-containing protein [Botrytis fragariae]KAF5876521.1 putative fad binding domain-containing protein [Botrytis fragariae]
MSSQNNAQITKRKELTQSTKWVMKFLPSLQLLSTGPMNSFNRIIGCEIEIPKSTSHSSSTPVSENKTDLLAIERQPIRASPKIPNPRCKSHRIVGLIPFCLGGGISIWTGTIDFSCDQILTAEIITADGSLIHASTDYGGSVQGDGTINSHHEA